MKDFNPDRELALYMLLAGLAFLLPFIVALILVL